MSDFAAVEDYLGLLRTRLLAAPEGGPAAAGLHLELAWTLVDRHDSEWGRDSDVDEIVEHAEAALRSLDRAYERRTELLGLAARARAQRWYRDGVPADRDAVVGHRRAQVAALSGDAPELAEALLSLAEALVSRAVDAERDSRQAADLAAGLLHACRAADLADGDPPDLLRYVLGHGLALRFDLGCAAEVNTAREAAELRADRDAAIEQFSTLYATMDADDPGTRYDVVEKLSELLYDRYSDPWPGAPPADTADLDRAIELLTGCAAGTGLDPPGMLTLGNAHADRYGEHAERADLEAGITWLERVLPETLGGLAATVELTLGELRHERAVQDPPSGRTADLHAAMAHYRAARDAGVPEWYGRLSALLTRARFDAMAAGGDVRQEDLQSIVETGSAAWKSLPPGDELRAESGLLLGMALHDQLPGSSRPLTEDEPRVTEAIEVLTEVEPAYRDEPEVRVAVWVMLGCLLTGRGQLRGDADDMRAASPWLSRALPELDDMPDGGIIVGNVALAMSTCGVYGGLDEDLDRAVALLRKVASDPRTARPAWARGMLGAVFASRAHRDPDLNDEAIELLRVSLGDLPECDTGRLVMLSNLAGALEFRYNRSRSLEDLRAAQRYRELIDDHLDRDPGSAGALPDDVRSILRSGRGQSAIVRGVVTGDHRLIQRGTADLKSALAGLPRKHPYRSRMRIDIGLGLAAQGAHGTRGDRLRLVTEAAEELKAGVDDFPPGHPVRIKVLMNTMAVLAWQALTSSEPRLLREAVQHADTAVAETGSDPGARMRMTACRAVLLVALTMLNRDPAHAREAVTELERVLADDAAPPDPDAEMHLRGGLARALRQTGENARAREAGHRALSAFGTVVLLQSGTDLALQRAGAGTEISDLLVNWCLDDAEPAEAAAALELGRGMVLHAATVAADVPAMLTEAGHTALADEWREASGRTEPQPWEGGQRIEDLLNLPPGAGIAVPGDLRGRVLSALDRTEAGSRLRNPPSIREIADALTATDADALAYVRPPVGGRCAHGVVVTAGGTVSAVPFPLLSAQMTGALDAFLADREGLARVAEAEYPDDEAYWDAEDAALRRWRRSLDLLCNWAWPALMRPLLRHVAGGARRSGPPRLVLVPTGALSAVPWHAARRRPRYGGPPVYACAEAVISYAASARQLVDVSRRGALDLHESPLIVGDPTGDLRYAIKEAAELRRRHYRGAHYLGCPAEMADGPGAAGEVLRRLPAAERPGASMIHIGCHAFVMGEHPGDSFLRLAEDQPLKVERLLHAAHGRDPRAPGGRVSLAACMSDLAGGRQDEALTLSTAFLAAGAATVVGARWEIPDETSALLMLKYHEFLNAGEPPRDALRRAQLWMLDPDRPAPESLDAALRQVLQEEGEDGAPCLPDVVGWAAFTHQGL